MIFEDLVVRLAAVSALVQNVVGDLQDARPKSSNVDVMQAHRFYEELNENRFKKGYNMAFAIQL